MIRDSNVGKYVKILVIAAVMLPLIVIAGVVYTERQQANSLQQVRAEELARLRTEAAAAWVSSQAAGIRGIANLNAVIVGDTNTTAAELGSFVTAETGFLALGYADSSGKVQVDTSGRVGRDIADSNYFIEAVAGREYQGAVAGADWLQSGDVTVLAAPVTLNGAVTGVVYGVLTQKNIEMMAAKLVPDTAGSEPGLGRWFVWLGSVYVLGIIPMLLLVRFLRRSPVQAAAFPEVSTDRPQPAVICQPAVRTHLPEPAAPEKPVDKQDELIAVLQQELALASKRAGADTVSQSTVSSRQPAQTPATVIDRALAARAYKPKAPEKPPQAPAGPSATLADRKQAAEEVGLQTPNSPQPVVSKKNIPSPPAIDAMTGLYSRNEFEKRIAARKGQPGTIMLVLSIDGIKVINDFLGRTAGDAIIMATADIIKTVAGSECMAARVDGDKFVVLLTETYPGRAEDLKKDVKYHMDLHNLRNPEVPLRITMGAAAADAAEDLQNVWKRADRDMESYKAVNRVEARKFIMWSMKRNRGRS